jgi:adenosylcobinamide-GDP ribazoletransferase
MLKPATFNLINSMIRNFIAAMHLLTVVPIPGKDCEKPEDTLYAFPLVGALLGGILWLFIKIPLPTVVLVALLLVLQTLLTRGFHLDGMADASDGLGGGYTRERVLEIMKDSQIGVFGALALILTLLFKFTLFLALLSSGLAKMIFVSMVISRTAQVFQCVTLPYARSSGTAATTVQNAQSKHLAVAFGLCALLLIPVSLHSLLLLLPAGLIASFLWGLYCRRRVGGITGDLLGATNELVEITVLTGALLI